MKPGVDLKSDVKPELYHLVDQFLVLCDHMFWFGMGSDGHYMSLLSMVLGSYCCRAGQSVPHTPWGCFDQSAVLWDGPLAQAWLLSVELTSPFFLSPFSKSYPCSRFPHSLSWSFQCIVITASWDFSPLGSRRIFLFIQPLVFSLSHRHTLSVPYVHFCFHNVVFF